MRLAHLLYAVALLASYGSLYGKQGLSAGLIVLAVWAYVFYSTYRPRALAIAVVLAIIFGLLLTPAGQVRGPGLRSHCKNNMKQIGIALHNYHETYGSFPPAYVADENGTPMHSWRVLLLPYFDRQERELYEQYDFSKPWDRPENLEIVRHMPKIYGCPSHDYETDQPETTSYFAIVGPETAWPGGEGSKMNNINDGMSNIILVIESHSPAIPWTEPRDLSLEEAADVFASEQIEPFTGHRYHTFFHEHFTGRHVLIGDGRIAFAPRGTDRDFAKQAMIINDRRPDPGWDFSEGTALPAQRFKWSVAIRFAIFLVLSFLPLPWVWLNPTGLPRTTPEAELSSGLQE